MKLSKIFPFSHVDQNHGGHHGDETKEDHLVAFSLLWINFCVSGIEIEICDCYTLVVHIDNKNVIFSRSGGTLIEDILRLFFRKTFGTAIVNLCK